VVDDEDEEVGTGEVDGAVKGVKDEEADIEKEGADAERVSEETWF
jgi:hypothetical protein